MIAEDRIKEKMILEHIDRFVRLLIELSTVSADKRDQFVNEAVGVIRAIHPALLSLIGDRPEHLEPLLRQLVSQKLPPPSILHHFGALQNILDTVITTALTPAEAEYAMEIDEDPKTDKVSVMDKVMISDQKTDHTDKNAEIKNDIEINKKQNQQPALEALLTSICPKEQICKNYFFRSVLFDYYLPAVKKGVLFWPAEKSLPKFYESLLQKEGISILKIAPLETTNLHALSRKLTRYLSS